jgi:hypothetical protein
MPKCFFGYCEIDQKFGWVYNNILISVCNVSAKSRILVFVVEGVVSLVFLRLSCNPNIILNLLIPEM